MGEHGDSSFVCWSQIKNAGEIPGDARGQIEQSVRNQAYEIISGKGATYFGIGATTAAILDSIVHNSKKVFSLSVPLHGEYGQSGISIGVPAKLGKRGVIKVIEKKFNKEESEKFIHSVNKLKEFL